MSGNGVDHIGKCRDFGGLRLADKRTAPMPKVLTKPYRNDLFSIPAGLDATGDFGCDPSIGGGLAAPSASSGADKPKNQNAFFPMKPTRTVRSRITMSNITDQFSI